MTCEKSCPSSSLSLHRLSHCLAICPSYVNALLVIQYTHLKYCTWETQPCFCHQCTVWFDDSECHSRMTTTRRRQSTSVRTFGHVWPTLIFKGALFLVLLRYHFTVYLMTSMQIVTRMLSASLRSRWDGWFDSLHPMTLNVILIEYLVFSINNLLSFEQYSCMYSDHAVNLLSSSVVVQLYLHSEDPVSLCAGGREGERDIRYKMPLQIARARGGDGKNRSRPRHRMVNWIHCEHCAWETRRCKEASQCGREK